MNQFEVPLFEDHALIKCEPCFMSGAYGSAGILLVKCRKTKAIFKMNYNTSALDEENKQNSVYEYNYCPICGQKLEKVER